MIPKAVSIDYSYLERGEKLKPKKAPPPELRHPGDLLSVIIFRITGQYAANCGVCGQRKAKMNRWGWIGCWKNRKEIIGWLILEAAKRGHQITEVSMFELLKVAFFEIQDQVKKEFRDTVKEKLTGK